MSVVEVGAGDGRRWEVRRMEVRGEVSVKFECFLCARQGRGGVKVRRDWRCSCVVMREVCGDW